MRLNRANMDWRKVSTPSACDFPRFISPALARFNRHLSIDADPGDPGSYLAFASWLEPADFRTSVKGEHLRNISHGFGVWRNAIASANYCILSSVVASKSEFNVAVEHF